MASKFRILCVEDEHLLREDLCEELQDAGYEVDLARNGAKAIRRIRANKPDLILCDMMMPEMDGPSLLKYVRKEMPGMETVPFLFLTALANKEDVVAGKRLGVDDYLTKPIDFDLLLATVEARLREVNRIESQNRSRLKQIHLQVQKYKADRGRVSIAMVSDKQQLVAPITSALLELGCEVRAFSEDVVKNNTFSPLKGEIVFLVYSSVVHFYLKILQSKKDDRLNNKYIILGAPNMNEGMKQGILDYGIDEIIEYPYKPVDIFRQVIDHLRGPEAIAAAEEAQRVT